MEFNITDSASNRIAELIEKDKDKDVIALRVSIDGGGCSGFMYQYDLVDTINDDDFIAEHNGIKVIIDQLSQQFLDNSTIDFITELGCRYFQINNPKASAKCGCGNSFAV